MKKPISLFILSAIVVITIVSCKKTNNGSSANNGVHLLKYIQLDTTQAAPYDTMEVDTYKYDNLNRFLICTEISYGNDTPGLPDSGIGSTGESYIGNSTVPYMTFNDDDGGQAGYNTDDTDYILSYTPGVMIKDSEINTSTTNGVSSSRFISVMEDILNGQTVIENTINYTPSFNSYSDTATQIFSNGDVISQTDNTVVGNQPYSNWNMTFDTHPNPFYNNGLTDVGILELGDDSLQLQPIQKNNTTEIIRNSPSAPLHLKYEYTYNSNGYPATVVEYDWSSGSPVFVYKGIYVY
ncbi:MAG TPA: hypothetical protein VK705_00500 [Ferruginibacter sp.]|nr:hypothetical protein [Ferruginibacter sp.]